MSRASSSASSDQKRDRSASPKPKDGKRDRSRSPARDGTKVYPERHNGAVEIVSLTVKYHSEKPGPDFAGGYKPLDVRSDVTAGALLKRFRKEGKDPRDLMVTYEYETFDGKKIDGGTRILGEQQTLQDFVKSIPPPKVKISFVTTQFK